MKKKLTIELEGEWVLKHRFDEELPIDLIKSEVQGLLNLEVKDSSPTTLLLLFENDKFEQQALEAQITEIFKKLYPDENLDGILDIEFSDLNEEKNDKAVDDEEKRRISEEALLGHLGISDGDDAKSSNPSSVEGVVSEINKLVGAAEFKNLANEIVNIAPEITRRNTFEVFANQCYLFSIGDGCGLSTYLYLLAKLVSATGLKKMHARPVIECKIGPYKESMEPFEDVVSALRNGDSNKVRILCIDISEWINITDNRFFKQFLQMVEKVNNEFIVVFRVPFVDKDLLARLKNSLNDLLYVKTIAFPPLSQNEIKICAQNEIKKFGFSATKTSWEFFQARISEEKSDGKFYGYNTVKKVVRELLYNKQLLNSKSKKSSDLITRNDTRALCGQLDENLSGTEQLNRLIGNEQIKQKIGEIIAQIELSIKGNSQERPCIHMRFVGNPGTGKTTVARIIGKVLKERGVLRVGNFYEYAGRDLCGKYVGETAPKTASICRDAYGSVLFIDEAYSLYRGDGNDRDYGREAIDTLIAEMENHRNDFVVIMAGYTDEMNKLMEGNNGLKSRMPYTIEFPNFTREQLNEIYASMVKSKFKYEPQLLDVAHNYFTSLSDEVILSKEFSNARFVRNLFERTWAKAAMRSQLDKTSEIVLTKDDFERASSEKDFSFNIKKKTIIGF